MANSALGTRNRPYRARLSYTNGEASATINVGDAVCFAANGESAVLCSSHSAALAPGLFLGIAVSQAAKGQPVEIISGGFVTAKLIVRTRTASGETWSTVQSIAAGNYFTIDTANNGLASSGAGAALASPYVAILPASVASRAGVASATSDTRLVSTATVGVFLRNMF